MDQEEQVEETKKTRLPSPFKEDKKDGFTEEFTKFALHFDDIDKVGFHPGNEFYYLICKPTTNVQELVKQFPYDMIDVYFVCDVKKSDLKHKPKILFHSEDQEKHYCDMQVENFKNRLKKRWHELVDEYFPLNPK